MIWSDATPIEAEMVCDPAYKPTAYPRSRPASFAHTIGTSRHSASTMSEKSDLLRPFLAEPAEELRSHAVTHGEQEQQEERGLDRARHRHAELADRNRGEQRRSDVTETEARQLLGSDEESNRERQEYGQFRVRAECFDDPLPDSHTLPLDAVAPAHVINATITVPQMASITLPTA